MVASAQGTGRRPPPLPRRRTSYDTGRMEIAAVRSFQFRRPSGEALTWLVTATMLIAGSLLPGYRGAGHQLMRLGALEQHGCGAAAARFWPEARDSARLVLRWLALALVLEVFLQRLVPDAWIVSLFSDDAGASIPLAVIVGASMYLDGYAALPLVRGLMDKGMSFGAALALMISGAAVSLYAAVAVVSIVRMRVFALYVLLAVTGACVAGYVAAWLV